MTTKQAQLGIDAARLMRQLISKGASFYECLTHVRGIGSTLSIGVLEAFYKRNGGKGHG